MAEPTLELTLAQVEVALEEGDFSTGRSLIESARRRFGDPPELAVLEQRIEEAERLSVQPEVDSWVRTSQEAIRVADYQRALAALRQAVAVSPQDAELGGLLERTEKAAERHAQTLERQQAASRSAGEIAALLEAGDLQAAREALLQARREHGRDSRFDVLEEQLGERVERAQRQSAEQHVARARQLLEEGDWRGALHQADLAHTLAPGHPEAAEVRERASARIADRDSRDQRQAALEEVEGDVERLIAAGEMSRADERLEQARELLGRDPLFERLTESLDEAKKDQEFRRRIEWRERRAKEAEALVQEAERLAQAGEYSAALQRLETAEELDPTQPGLAERVTAYRASLALHLEEKARADRLDQAVAGVAAHLDAMRLDEAARALRLCRSRFAPDPRFDALEKRLQGLEEAEVDVLPTPSNLAQLSVAMRRAIREREKALAEAYSWKQAFTVALRPQGGLLLLALALVLGAAHAAARSAPWVDLLAVLICAAVAPAICLQTLGGMNHLTLPAALWSGRRAPSDAFAHLLLFAVALLPAWGFVAGRGAHGLLEGSAGWLVLSALLWAGCLLVSAAMGPGLAFGWGSLAQPARLIAGGITLLAVAGTLYATVAVALLLRTAVEPELGIPLGALAEAYGLITVPHLAGVMVRSRRLAWASLA
ncbi:MAG: hypothetical protein AAF725_16365 [Acidobacteriota bacterium]